jgi:hypothetical protein
MLFIVMMDGLKGSVPGLKVLISTSMSIHPVQVKHTGPVRQRRLNHDRTTSITRY